MVVEAVVIVLVVVFCILLFHTYSKVQFILNNAICRSTKNNNNNNKKQLKNVLYLLHPRRTLSYCLTRKGNAVLHLCQLFLEFFDIF